MIYADAFLEPIQPLGCLLIYDGNKILFSGSDNGNKVGLSVWEDNYAIIRNNIVKGFRNAVEIGYNNKVLIYNNTFAENNGGVSLYGTIDSVSIYNNIFIHYSTRAIDLDVSTGYKADNRAWINRNLWYSPESPYACPYINCDTAGTGIVNGNTFSINKDPKFADSLNYQLLPGSPAIDMGDSVIPAFQYEFKVLDTTIALTSLIDIHDYFGNAPDIGAKEYNPTVSVKNKQKAVYFYRLQQNYPNPFNPSTNIEFQIANFGFVTLKIYDVLGREIETLVNEEKSPGRYEVKFSASNLASGLYFYRITSGNFSETKKMLLLK